jgi:hypothetical protein
MGLSTTEEDLFSCLKFQSSHTVFRVSHYPPLINLLIYYKQKSQWNVMPMEMKNWKLGYVCTAWKSWCFSQNLTFLKDARDVRAEMSKSITSAWDQCGADDRDVTHGHVAGWGLPMQGFPTLPWGSPYGNPPPSNFHVRNMCRSLLKCPLWLSNENQNLNAASI